MACMRGETQLPSKRAAALYRAERFNERVFIYGFELKLRRIMFAGPPSDLQLDGAKIVPGGNKLY